MAYIDGRPCYYGDPVIHELLCPTPPGTPGEKGEVGDCERCQEYRGRRHDGASDSYAYEDIHSNRIVPARGPTYGHQKIVVYGLNIKGNQVFSYSLRRQSPCLKTKS